MPEHNTKSDSSISAVTSAETLCFDKNDFMKANFSVDEFLHKNRTAPSLEQLRDNLGLYLKGLRSSMIDLINEDYADFVSLSGNLVGLDQSIDVIQRPLEQFRTEIESIQTLIQDNESEIRAHLERKRQLRELKRNLQSLQKVYESIEKLEDLLAAPHSQVKTSAVEAQRPVVVLERAALELIQLKFNERFCASYLSASQLQRIAQLEEQLLAQLRKLFNSALESSSSTAAEPLERCLRIYLTLDAAATAEMVFREDFVAPYMSAHISEQCLQNSPQGLAGVYSRILGFISLHMTDLLRLTQYAAGDKLRGFNFLVQSFWTDVEMRLETHMTSIFAPGNSEVFYAKYKCTRDFLSKIEELLAAGIVDGDSVQAFRQHKLTRSFHARWNLPVYFQICFQEIAGKFEALLEPTLRHDTLCVVAPSTTTSSTTPTVFQLSPFDGAQIAIQRCWTEGVYLPEVFPKFYKLTVQIILRLSRWITEANRCAQTTSELPAVAKLNKTTLLIALHTDIEKFIALLTEIPQTIYKNIPKEKQDNALVKETLAKSFGDLKQVLGAHLSTIQESLVRLLIAESGLENVRQVSDLPRLYRKTNRDVPTRCSGYVEQMMRPLKSFAAEQHAQLGQQVVCLVLAQVFNKITADYFVAVSDVLTSVQKTEESLRRLRNLKSGAAAMAASTSSQATMSDDDKIRMQLRVDVVTWTAEVSKLNFMPEQIEKLLDLNNIVEESIKVKE